MLPPFGKTMPRVVQRSDSVVPSFDKMALSADQYRKIGTILRCMLEASLIGVRVAEDDVARRRIIRRHSDGDFKFTILLDVLFQRVRQFWDGKDFHFSVRPLDFCNNVHVKKRAGRDSASSPIVTPRRPVMRTHEGCSLRMWRAALHVTGPLHVSGALHVTAHHGPRRGTRHTDQRCTTCATLRKREEGHQVKYLVIAI